MRRCNGRNYSQLCVVYRYRVPLCAFNLSIVKVVCTMKDARSFFSLCPSWLDHGNLLLHPFAVLGIDGFDFLKPGTISGMREAAGGCQSAASEPPVMCVCMYLYVHGWVWGEVIWATSSVGMDQCIVFDVCLGDDMVRC